ncbi:hypothetical protein BCR43DRAFT_489318 [Syncephalastrum racemosum]|uniref:FAR1 domain-containing protein n=1 Tax=Syncephalastrum racemosum TaxID=13706 RepID=A0A1X2HK95_SYNRA|nr:hypothetical protein BCR43DRAFT_489318 [Syncephalastrum racemosum]
MKQNQANQATQDESSGDDLLLALQGPPQSSFYDTLLNQAFPNSDAAITFCRRLCAQFGFTVKQESSTHRNIYVYCSREGFPDSRRNPKSNPKRNRPSKRCDCRWRVVLNESKNTHEWRFRKSNNPDASLHNHELMRPEEIEQAWPKEVLDMICDLARQQLSTHDIRGRVQMRFPEITWNERRFYNRLSEERQKIRQRDTVLRAQELTVELNKVCMAASGCEELTRYAHAQARQLLKSVCDMAQIDIATLPQPIVLDPDEDEFKEWDHAETIETAPKGHTTVVVPRHTFHVRVHNQRTMNEMHVLRNRRRSRSSLTLEDDVSEQAGRKQARLFSHDEAAAQAQAHAQAQAAAAQMAVATQYNMCPAPKVEGGLVPSAASSRNSQQQFLFQQQQQQHHSMAMQTFNGVPHQHHHHHSTRPISYPQRPHHHAPPPPPPPPPPSQSVPPAPPAHPYHQPTPPGAEYSSSSPMPYPPLDASGSTAVASTTSTPSPASQSSAQHLMYPASTTTTTTTATSSNTTKLRSSSFSDMATSMPPNQLDSSARRRSFQPGLHPGMDPTISYAFHPSSGLIHEHHRDAPNGDFPLGQRMPQSMMVVSGERGPRQNQVPCYDGYGW